MQLADVDRVDETFEALKPVAGRDCDHRPDVIGRKKVELEIWDWWYLRGVAEIDPDHAARFSDRIGFRFDSGTERGSMFDGFSRHIDAGAGRIEGPTVIDAGERIAVVVGEREGRSAMGACLVKTTQLPVPGSEYHDTGGQSAPAYRVAAGLDQACSHEGHPELTHIVAHRRTRAHACEQFVVRGAEHGLTPSGRAMWRSQLVSHSENGFAKRTSGTVGVAPPCRQAVRRGPEDAVRDDSSVRWSAPELRGRSDDQVPVEMPLIRTSATCSA